MILSEIMEWNLVLGIGSSIDLWAGTSSVGPGFNSVFRETWSRDTRRAEGPFRRECCLHAPGDVDLAY